MKRAVYQERSRKIIVPILYSCRAKGSARSKNETSSSISIPFLTAEDRSSACRAHQFPSIKGLWRCTVWSTVLSSAGDSSFKNRRRIIQLVDHVPGDAAQ